MSARVWLSGQCVTATIQAAFPLGCLRGYSTERRFHMKGVRGNNAHLEDLQLTIRRSDFVLLNLMVEELDNALIAKDLRRVLSSIQRQLRGQA